MEFTQVKGNTWCLHGKGLIPVYRLDERRCILLDSGWKWEREALKKALERNDLLPVGAVTTHGHPDHMGNHGWLEQTYGTHLCMPVREAVLANREERERQCREYVERMGGYLDDIEFTVSQVIGPEDGMVPILGVPFSIHHTPGHTPDHICIGTPDGVCYLGDLVVVGEELKRVGIPYQLSYYRARESMKKMGRETSYDCYIAAHRGIVEHLSGVMEENLALLNGVEDAVLSVLEQPVGWEELVAEATKANRLVAKNEHQAKAYNEFFRLIVAGLEEQGKVTRTADQKWMRRPE